MKTPLIKINIPSIYKNPIGERISLPFHMAKCTPDTQLAIMNIAIALEKKGGRLVLSDLFRSYEKQSASHMDYVMGRKKAFSPPPGGSFHEAGRGFDLDLEAMKIPLREFWEIAAGFGVTPIIQQPDKRLSEAWHFDCRGSHQLVYDYYKAKKGNNFSPYTASAASAILSIGVKVDAFGPSQLEASIQSCLIRLGMDIGNMDGVMGRRTKAALDKLGIRVALADAEEILTVMEDMVLKKFPGEGE